MNLYITENWNNPYIYRENPKSTEMASIKQLKKDINYLSYELLTEAFTYRHFHPDMTDKRFYDIISRIVQIRNELISRVNHPGETAGMDNVHAHFSQVRQDMTKLVAVMNDFDNG